MCVTACSLWPQKGDQWERLRSRKNQNNNRIKHTQQLDQSFLCFEENETLLPHYLDWLKTEPEREQARETIREEKTTLERLNAASVSPSEESSQLQSNYPQYTPSTATPGSQSVFLTPPAVLPADQLAKIAATAQHQLSSFHSFDHTNPYALPTTQASATAPGSSTLAAAPSTSAALTSMLSLSDPAQLNSLNMDLPSVLNQYNPYGNPYGSMYGKPTINS